MLPLLLLAASIAADPADLVEASREIIGVAASIRCPKAVGDEVVVCGRASARDKFLLPLPSPPTPGSAAAVDALGERKRLLAIGKWDAPSPVGPGGETGWTLHSIAAAVDGRDFIPLHRQFEGPDILIEPRKTP